MTHLSHSPEDTQKIADDFAATLTGGELVLIDGELGAGKTAFVQGLAEAMGASAARSPTFAVMNVYKTNLAGIRELVHLDFYRLAKPEQVAELGLEDWLGRTDTVVVAEWPPESLPILADTKVIRISIRVVSASDREINIETV